MPPRLTATQALAHATNQAGYPKVSASTFICPHPDCRTLALHRWGYVNGVTVQGGGNPYRAFTEGAPTIVSALCEACLKEVIFIDGRLHVPNESEAPAPPSDLPSDLAEDYEEARRVLPVSPRGAAALLRLLVQKLLPLIGADEDDINKMIGQLVKNGVINPKIQQALDSVRVIGNEAVHPGTMDLKDDSATAFSLFNLINYIVEKAITEPKEIDAIYAGLPAGKLAGIINRDKSKEQKAPEAP